MILMNNYFSALDLRRRQMDFLNKHEFLRRLELRAMRFDLTQACEEGLVIEQMFCKTAGLSQVSALIRLFL